LDYSNFAYFDAEDAIGSENIIEFTPFRLSTPEEYYKFKEESSNKITKITKIFSKPRDLKPSGLKFTLVNGEKRNQYDLDSVKLLFKYNELLEKGTIDNASFTILEKFANYIIPEQDFKTVYTNKTYQKVLRHYLGKWTNLSLHLLKHNKVFTQVAEDVQFNEFFYGFSLTDNFEDIKDMITNTVPILSYTLDKAEIIMGDMNRSKFNRELHESMSQIIEEKESFFANKMIDFYAEDDTDADVKILVNNHDSPIYVKYVDEKHLPGIDNSINIKAMKELTDSGVVTTFVRYNDDGEVIYKLPQNARVRKENGKEVIYIQGVQSLKNEVVGMSSNFINDTTQLYNSFRNNMKAFIPLMNNKTSEALFSKDKYQTNLNYYTIKSFSRYSGYMPTNRQEVYTSE